jgi:hypothetical protein
VRSHRSRRTAAAVFAATLALSATASAAIVGLPGDGSQVNNDPAAGIDPAKDAGESDVTGGALAAGGVNVPWATFEQQTSGQQQVFVRSFAGGKWTTRGNGTVGGLSSAAPTFPGSLNFDQGQDGEAPAIDFAGAGRTVPWDTWYEKTTSLGGKEQIFASRFDQATGKWVFAGQNRHTGAPNVPSLNIHTNQDAENPSVAGGATTAGNDPGPWVTWQEISNAAPNSDQIFVNKPIKVGTAACPAATKPTPADATVLGGFCWQQVGIDRINGATDPSLNVDPTRDGIEPDVAFTGANDTVPWVVWYEVSDPHSSSLPTPLQNNEMVFAAKGTPNASADGGFQWTSVGNAGSGVLDTSGTTNHAGACAESTTAEKACSLNGDPVKDAEDPRVAAGRMAPTGNTVPWVTWAEDVGGTTRIFVSRLVGGDHFVIANGGQPISPPGANASKPDITFSGNTPYVSWREEAGTGTEKVFTGHLVNAADPSFVLDTPGGVSTTVPSPSPGLRPPISSGCTANPFNGDGNACQGGALGTPHFLFNDGASPQRLLAKAYSPASSDVQTGSAAAITTTSATVTGAVNPAGSSVRVHFEFGPTTGYGSVTPNEVLPVGTNGVAINASLSGLSPGTTYHYRVVASTDFGSVNGVDRTFTTATNPPPPPPPDRKPPKISSRIATGSLKALLKAKALKLRIALSEAGKVSVSASARPIKTRTARGSAVAAKKRKKAKAITLGSARVTFTAAGKKTVKIQLSRKTVNKLKTVKAIRLTVSERAADTAGNRTRQTTTTTLR